MEPFFTFYGFRYVKVSGISKVDPKDFTGVVLYSDLQQTLQVSTNDVKINRLMQNSLWGQRGNFMDVPTDCPQRDERLGWTADAQVFVNTACYHMDCYSFYKKYLKDLRYDQKVYYEGDIPMYSPSLKKAAGNGGAVWADAGTIIPWNLYQAYGDERRLNENYSMMKEYTDTLIMVDKKDGNRHMITSGAYRILFNEDFPGWLYAVNLGATTIWERWNSMLPDGRVNGMNMNSFNHYAYGSVCEAIYQYIAGLRFTKAGCKSALIAPKLNYRLKHMKLSFDSPLGMYQIEWVIQEDGVFQMDVIIPYGATARILLPSHKDRGGNFRRISLLLYTGHRL